MSALEAKLIITAEDRTKAAFEAIMARMDKIFAMATSIDRAAQSTARAISSTEAAIGRAGHAMAASASNMERAAQMMERAAVATSRSAREVEGTRGAFILGSREHTRAREDGGHGGHGLSPYAASNITSRHGGRHALAAGGYGAGGFVGAVGAVVAGEVAIYTAEERGEREHEKVRETISGMSPMEREDAEKRAALLAARYPQIKQTDVMHTLRNVRGVTGSYAEAGELADDILRTRIVAQAARPGQDVEPDFDKLIKGMEQYGVTQDPKAFREAMRRVQKVLAVEGDTLTAGDIYQSFKYTRQALPGTPQRFMLGTAPRRQPGSPRRTEERQNRARRRSRIRRLADCEKRPGPVHLGPFE